MKTNFINRMLLITAIVGLFWSCSKDETTNPDTDPINGKLHKITLINTGDTATYEYKYDSIGRVKEILLPIAENNFQPKASFKRNIAGQIITYNLQTYYYINGTEFKNYSEIYNYSIGTDGKYKAAEIIIQSGSLLLKEEEKYTYTGNHITGIDRDAYYDNIKPENSRTITYKYDNQGNISNNEITIFDDFGEYQYKSEFNYDNKVFPVESLDAPFALGDDEIYDNSKIFFQSTNNLLTATYRYEDGNFITETHAYTYNDEGKPITANIIFKDSKGNSLLTSDIKYIYY